MRIAVDARPLAAPTTGIGRYTGALLRAWPTSDHTFLLYSHAPLPALDLPVPHSTRHGSLTGKLRALGTPFAQARFGQWAREDGADLFWSPRHHLPTGLADLPAVVTIHDLAWVHVPETMRWAGRMVERFLMPSAIRRADLIVTDSESTRRDILSRFPEAAPRIRIIPAASGLDAHADPHPSQAEAEQGTPFMLFVGTVEPRKNLERVVDAFSSLHASHPVEHRLVIVGNRGWRNRQVRTAIARSPAAGRIEVRGTVGDEELARLYQTADFLVAPSLYEGFGLQLVEAFGFGKPVITGNVSAMPEVAGDAGILVNPRSTDEIRDAMYRLISDRSFRDSLARAATVRAGRFSWQASAARMLEVFETVGTARQDARP